MDDCTLKKLAIKPGALSPPFHTDILEYNSVVSSEYASVQFECVTNDTSASYYVKGSDEKKQVPLKEGATNDIKVEVTSENGTTRNYWVHVYRLSAKDALLTELKLGTGVLQPEFKSSIFQYSCLLPCDVNSLLVTPVCPDQKAAIALRGHKLGTATPLNYGQTVLSIDITSPDQSNKQTYSITVVRQQFPRFIRFSNPQVALQAEDPLSLSPYYQPISIKDSQPKHTFSKPIIDKLSRVSKVDPLSEMPLPADWRIDDHVTENEIAHLLVCVPLIDGSVTSSMKLSDVGTIVKDCHKTIKLLEEKSKNSAQFKHSIEQRQWEKQLCQIHDESDPVKLLKMAEESKLQYLSEANTVTSWGADEHPALQHLHHAISCCATALSSKGKDAAVHCMLAMLLEEKYIAEDLRGFRKAKFASMATANQQAKESSKEEECAAICQLRGVPPGSSIALQLKAIDEEYHHLIQSGQSARADKVQELFAWKSKRAHSMTGATVSEADDDQSPLGQAFIKYQDALSLDDMKDTYHFHVGRFLVMQGNYDDAVRRLNACLSWNPQHLMARVYQGLALCKRTGGPGESVAEALQHIMEVLEALLQRNTDAALSTSPRQLEKLFAEDLLQTTNVYVLTAVIEAGRHRQALPPSANCMAASDILHTAAMLACQALINTSPGETYRQVEWCLLHAHTALLDHLLKAERRDEDLITRRAESLSSLINSCSIPSNPELVALQVKTCQYLVQAKPCCSRSLYLLGSAQLALHNLDPKQPYAAGSLADALKSFEASLSMEGKPATGTPPAELTAQEWWQKAIATKDEVKARPASASKSKEAAAAAKPGSASKAAATPAPATRGGATAGRGGATAGRGGATSRGGGATAAKAPPPPAKAAPAAAAPARGVPAASRGRGGTPATRGAPAGRGKGATSTVAPPSQPVAAAAPVARPPSAKKEAEPATPPSEQKPASAAKRPVCINPKTYHTRLGMARALSRTSQDVALIKQYYQQVIEMMPHLHDAYIESAEFLTKADPLGAVDIYCKFPVPEKPSFDDAFIFTEIVRLLLKAEQFDDPRLAPNMIALGKVMGIASLEKYVQILDNKLKTDTLKKVYAGVHGKNVNDPDLQAFFKMKCWI